MYGILCVMKTATIREAQHNFSALLKLVQRGEEVQVLSRKTPVARIVPATHAILSPGKVNWSGHQIKLKKLWKGKGAKGTSTDDLLNELRGDR
jgi:prevent-host-death family protein